MSQFLTVVGDVLALRIYAIDLQSVFGHSVVVVLVHDALCMIAEVEISLVVPPVFIVAVLVELTSPVIEAMSDFVSDHEADCPEVQIAVSAKTFVSKSNNNQPTISYLGLSLLKKMP